MFIFYLVIYSHSSIISHFLTDCLFLNIVLAAPEKIVSEEAALNKAKDEACGMSCETP